MRGPNLAVDRYAKPLEGATVPQAVEALLANYGLKLATVTRAHNEQPILSLVDISTGMPVRRLPEGVAEAVNRLAADARPARGSRR